MAKTFKDVKLFFSFFNVLYLFAFNHQQNFMEFRRSPILGPSLNLFSFFSFYKYCRTIQCLILTRMIEFQKEYFIQPCIFWFWQAKVKLIT